MPDGVQTQLQWYALLPTSSSPLLTLSGYSSFDLQLQQIRDVQMKLNSTNDHAEMCALEEDVTGRVRVTLEFLLRVNRTHLLDAMVMFVRNSLGGKWLAPENLDMWAINQQADVWAFGMTVLVPTPLAAPISAEWLQELG
ncbi:hypothetical protein EDC04DRAFT_2599997 [Pisolithus marmoratus]|nr:hypothetical protein EDC04DRAFT_2599997 [Pisolithus marmoratus]